MCLRPERAWPQLSHGTLHGQHPHPRPYICKRKPNPTPRPLPHDTRNEATITMTYESLEPNRIQRLFPLLLAPG